MIWLSLLAFFAYTYGLGFSLASRVKESDNFFERLIMRVGIGLSALVVLGIIINALHIPMDYRILLVISLALPLHKLAFRQGYRQIKVPRLKLTHANLAVLAVLLLFAASLFMYASGAFRYPYLENDDPWGHATAAKYVAVEKTAFDSPYLNFQYMDPYPPGYDMTLGILQQTSSSVYWNIKFFNALLISLSTLFFYFFALEFTGSRGKALFATAVLASVPAYLSHFIWAPVLAMAVFFQAMYAFELIKHDKRWWIVAGVGFASILLAHPTHAVKLTGFLLIYLAVKMFASRRQGLRQYVHSLFGVALGAALSLFWWGFKLGGFAGLAKGGLRSGTDVALERIESSPSIIVKLWTIITQVFNAEGGTATRAYSLSDFIIAHGQGLINNPVGFGMVASVLVIVGMVSAILRFATAVPKFKVVVPVVVVASLLLTVPFLGISLMQLVLALLIVAFAISLLAVIFRNEPQHVWLAITLGWLLFAFLGVNSKTFNLPVGLFAFRFWMVLAIPFALIAAEGLFTLVNGLNRLKLDSSAATMVKVALIALIVLGLFFTSARQKYEINTSFWPPGAFWSGQDEVVDYLWLDNLPPGTNVFTFSNPDQVIGFDKFSCGWCRPEYEMKQRFVNVTPAELSDFLKENDYEYVIIGGIQVRQFGYNETVALINSLGTSPLFTIAHQGQAALVFKTA